MPSWKKVIISGSNAALNSLTVSNGITGSLFGTASWAVSSSFASTSSFLNSTTNAFIQNGNSFGATALLGTNDNNSLALETSGSTRMFISSSGNVGIGITTPSASLQVAGDVRLASAADGANALWLLRNSSNNWSLQSVNGVGEIWRVAGNTQTFYQVATTANSLTVTPGGNSTTQALVVTSGSYPAATLLRVGVNSLVVTGSNVGIGTTTPNSASLTVNGNVWATSFTGSLFGTSSWAVSASWAPVATTVATASFVTASNVYGPFGSNSILSSSFAQTASYVNPLNQNVVITGSLTVSGSIGTVFTSNVDTLVLTGSLLVTGSTVLSGPLTVGISTITTNTLTPSAAGANLIFNQATGSFTAAKYLYTVTSASNARTGEVMAVWNGTTTQYTDNSTLDIGSTTAVTASVSIVTAQAQFNMQTTNAGWTIKSQVTYL